MNRKQAEKIVLCGKTKEKFIEEKLLWFSVSGDGSGCEPEETKNKYRAKIEADLEKEVQEKMKKAYA